MLVKALRKIVDNNKGFLTFWLVVVFLGGLCGKNIAGSSATLSGKTNVAHSSYKHDLTATSDDDSSNGFLDSFEKDFDSDDAEFTLFEDLYSKAIFTFSKKLQFIRTQLQQQSDNDMLYDLYCNWKFHLS